MTHIESGNWYQERYEHWFAEACRHAELVGGISYWVNAPLHEQFGVRITPARALREIRRLLDTFDRNGIAAADPSGGESHA